jgi:hypothetical protein
MSETIVFLGPSLDLAAARACLDATYLPPIKRGDLAAVPSETRIVGIVDGEFHQSLAVSPKEVLALLDCGVTVCGASSIGALRAAETHMEGMIGIGAIFEMYRDGFIDADDEVAVAYCPSTHQPISEPLVNIRFALGAAVAQGIISQNDADEIIRTLKDVYFPSRSYQLVARVCPALDGFFRSTRYDQKRDDALLLLHTIADLQRARVSASLPGTAGFS